MSLKPLCYYQYMYKFTAYVLLLTASVVVGLSALSSDASAAMINVNVHRFYKLGSGTHFYTASETEAKRVRANMSKVYRYEGVSFSASSANRSELTPVYRFYNFNAGTHFYTTSSTEASRVRSSMSKIYRYEGIAYFANTANSGSNLVTVYRFYNKATGTHFYTASSSERDRLRSKHTDVYRYETTAYGAARYYKNCTEARKFGDVPIYRNEPGYGIHLDRDNDGIACEIE